MTPGKDCTESLEEGPSFDFENSDLGLPEFFMADAAGVFRDDLTDSVQDSVQETDDVPLATCSLEPASVSGFSNSYNLRPRRAQRVTSWWLDNKWTNPYHTKRFDVV